MTQQTTLKQPRSAAAEAIRTLRTNLIFSSVEKPLHTLLITSPATPADKSETAANLAVAFAQSGHKTILVDADMRRPTQSDLWNTKSDVGLTSMMVEDALMSNPPLVDAPGVEGLKLLLSGPAAPSPADLLASDRMNEVIGVLKARADYVLFDAPPVLVASDTPTLGNKLDGVLMVIRAGNTRRDQALRARQTLERVNVRVLGAALTNAPRERTAKYGNQG
jgi:capsular exopolysaccharide synthesis family protein